MKAAAHPRQGERLAALHRLKILDTPREAEFDDVVALVSRLCDVPVAVVNLIDADRQWFKAEVGLGICSTPLETSLCSHVILENDFVEIPDTLTDPRMADNPLCTVDGGFRFYAGALLKTDEGLPIGTLCVLDNRPRELTELQRDLLRVLSQRVMREIEHRHNLRQQDVLRREIDHRVKNSLAMIGAVLHLQAAAAPSDDVRAALDAVRARLSALEAFHEELHQENLGEAIALDSIVRRTAAKLGPILPAAMDFAFDLPAVDLTSEQASALALIINEFATNSAKHAFDGSAGGTIRIDGRVHDGIVHLALSDNGSGDAAALASLEENKGLGVRVIETLARSVGGRALWSAGDPGMRLDLDLPLRG